MDTPPINSTSSASEIPGGEGPTPSQQAQNDLNEIQQIDDQIEQALAKNESPSQIQALVQKLQNPMQDLTKLAHQLSPNEANLIDNAEEQYQFFSQGEEVITPSAIALFQGTCDTVSQLISAPSGANINVQALTDQNQLSELANALQYEMQAQGGSGNTECEEILNSMNSPLKDLQQLATSGALTSDQTNLVDKISQFYQDNLTKYETTNPDTVGDFQALLSKLDVSLLNE